MVEKVTGVVLCGGQGQRLGGVDKPLLDDGRGDAVIDHVLSRLAPQVDDVIISANRKLEAYRQRASAIVVDTIVDGGPLAGINAAAQAAGTPWLFVCPGDAPKLPRNIVAELRRGAGAHGAVYAHDGHRPHYLHLLVRRQLALDLGDWLRAGDRAVHRWLSLVEALPLQLETGAGQFDNINVPADYQRWRDEVWSMT
jgi:molybdenum cofactor guanylyltransferase